MSFTVFIKSQLGAGINFPETIPGKLAFISVRDYDKKLAVKLSRQLVKLGFKLIATRGTAAEIKKMELLLKLLIKLLRADHILLI